MKSAALIPPLLVIAFIAFIILLGVVFAFVLLLKLIQRGAARPVPPSTPATPPAPVRPPPMPAEPPTLPAPPPGARGRHFVYVRLPGEIMPEERGEKYEDPLFDLLEQQRLGAIVGGGTMLNEDKSIAFSGIDIELVNLDSALHATRAKLRELGVPPGSTLEYEVDGKKQSLPIHEG